MNIYEFDNEVAKRKAEVERLVLNAGKNEAGYPAAIYVSGDYLMTRASLRYFEENYSVTPDNHFKGNKLITGYRICKRLGQ